VTSTVIRIGIIGAPLHHKGIAHTWKTKFLAKALRRKEKLKKIHCRFDWLLGGGESLAELLAVVVAFLGDFGFQEAAMAAAFVLDFFGLENEPGGL
jgi:hypothetical protein